MFDTIWAPKMKKTRDSIGGRYSYHPQIVFVLGYVASIYLEPDEMVDHEPDAVYDGPSPFYSPIC